jgi:hypothetical protein
MTYLYKYRRFEPKALHMLCESEVHFSDPLKFNDPLDCSPTVIVDIALSDLKNLYCKMIGEELAKKNLTRFQYCEDEDGAHAVSDEFYRANIAEAIKNQLDIEMKHGRGVFSLGGQWNSPLMWSHYADEHRGICIEYDVSLSVCDPPRKVDYKGDRGILASDIMSFVFHESASAKEKIEQKYFYTKAGQWEYEEEWRYIRSHQGSISAPFHITGIHFGMRCDRSVASSIVRLMRESIPQINFYRISPNPNSFKLERTQIGTDELDGNFRPMQAAAMIFGTPIQHPDLS